MNWKELFADQYIKNWLSGIGAKKTTREGYIDSMRIYTEFLGKTPEQIILESEEDIRKGRLMREKRIFSELREFREHLERSDIAPMSVKSKLTGVRSFYKFYDIILPSLPRSAVNARPLMENRPIPGKEDIRDVLSVADPIEKALVLIGVSSGLAVNEISNLRLEEFYNGYDPETQITTLHLIREKVNYEFYTFLSPEASKAVFEYLEYRNRPSDSGDKVRQNQLLKQRVRYNARGDPIGYLFVRRAIVPEYLALKDEKEAEELRKLSTPSIQKIYRELNEKARKSSPYGKRNLVRSHTVRKYFNSTLLANGASIFFTDFLMGHQIDSTRDAYYRADPKKLREEYQKYLPYLTTCKELDVSESSEYQKLKQDNEILARETARATVERAEIKELKSELERLKQFESELELMRKTLLQMSPETAAVFAARICTESGK